MPLADRAMGLNYDSGWGERCGRHTRTSPRSCDPLDIPSDNGRIFHVDGATRADFVGGCGPYSYFPPEVLMLAMLYM